MSSRSLIIAAALVVLLVVATVLLLGDAAEPAPSVVPVPSATPAAPPRDVTRLPEPADAGPLEPLTGGAAVPAIPSVDQQAATGSTSTDTLGTVSGVLLDAGGSPVAGEPVDLLVTNPWYAGQSEDDVADRTRSDGEGRFVLATLPGATHRLLAGGVGWARTAVDRVRAGDDLVVTLERALSVSGVVVDVDTGAPIPGATVGAFLESGGIIDTTGVDGAFRIAPVPDGPLLLGAYALGYELGSDDSVVPGGDSLTLALRPGRDVTGQILERDTLAPVPGAEVRLVVELTARLSGSADPLEGEQLVSEQVVTTGADGRYLIPGAPSWGFRLHIAADGYVPAIITRHEERVLRPDEEIAVVLVPAVELRGVVVDGDGSVAAGSTVSLEADARTLTTTKADAQGAWTLPMAAWDGSGRLTVHATSPAGDSGRHAVKRKDHDGEIYLTVGPPAVLDVLVVAGGEPLRGAQLLALSAATSPTLGVSDADGRVTLVHQLAGPHIAYVQLVARHGLVESLPLTVDLLALPEEPLVMDVDLGGWIGGSVVTVWDEPVAGARLRVAGTLARSGPDGRFRLGPVDDTTGKPVSVSVTADALRSTKVEAYPGDEQLRVELQPVVEWKGRIMDTATGLPVESFVGRLQRYVDGRPKSPFKDTPIVLKPDRSEPGAFSVKLADAGRYRLRVLATDHVPGFGPELDFDGVTPPPFTDVFVSPAAVLELTLIDAGGRPISGCQVAVAPYAPPKQGGRAGVARSARTSGSGLLRLNLGSGGVYTVTARSMILDTGPLVVSPGPPVQRTYRLGDTGDIEVRVRDADDQPVMNPKITVRTAPGSKTPHLQQNVNPAGAPLAVPVDVLIPGTYTVTARAREGTAAAVATVTARRRTIVDLVLEPAQGKSKGKGKAGTMGQKGGR